MTLLLAALLALPAAAEDWNARVTDVSGTVLIYSKDSQEGLPAEAQTPLEDGDRVETGADGRAELALEADSVVELGAGTTFTVGSTKKADSWFSLDVGSLVAKLKSFQSRRAALRVRTPTAVAAVRGTEFGVEVGEDGETSVGVYDEGKVAVTAGGEDGGGEETLLTPKQETTLAPGETAFKVRRLERLERRRERMAHLRARREVLRKDWKDIPPGQRRELRQKWREGMRERLKNMPPEQREKLMKGLQERRERLQERRAERRERREERRGGEGGDERRMKGQGNGPGGPGNGPGGPGGPGGRMGGPGGRGPGGPGGPGGGPRREMRGGGGGRRR